MRFLANKRWSFAAFAAAITALLAIGRAQTYVSQAVVLHAKRSEAVATGQPTASREVVQQQASQYLHRATIVGRTGLASLVTGVVFLGTSVVKKERSLFQHMALVGVIIAGLLAFMFV